MTFIRTIAALFFLVLPVQPSQTSAQKPAKSSITISAGDKYSRKEMHIAIPDGDKYSRKEIRVHSFLWTNWQRRQTTIAQVTFFGTDAGNVYTIHLKRDAGDHWIVEEYMRHYQVVGPGSTGDKLVVSGTALRRFRLPNGTFAVRILTSDSKTVPLFE